VPLRKPPTSLENVSDNLMYQWKGFVFAERNQMNFVVGGKPRLGLAYRASPRCCTETCRPVGLPSEVGCFANLHHADEGKRMIQTNGHGGSQLGKVRIFHGKMGPALRAQSSKSVLASVWRQTQVFHFLHLFWRAPATQFAS